jgi:hypothetical protein
VKRPTKKAERRAWLASLICKRAEHLGTVYALDRETVERVAAEQFGLREEQRRRLALVEQLQRGSS